MATGGQNTTKKTGSSGTGRTVNGKNTSDTVTKKKSTGAKHTAAAKASSAKGTQGRGTSGRSTQGRSTAASGRNTSVRGTTRGTTGTGRYERKDNQLFEEISVLILVAAALILILSNFNLAGVVGEKIKWFMFGIMGVVEYIFPVILLITLIFVMSNRDMIAVARVKATAAYVLAVLCSAIWQCFCKEPDIKTAGVAEYFRYSASECNGGGFFGGLLCKLLSPLGMLGTLVILVILVIICVILITEKSFVRGLMNIGKSGSRMMHAAKQDYDMYKEHSRERYADSWEEDDDESEEEYLKRRREEKEARYKERRLRREELEKQAEIDSQDSTGTVLRREKKVRGVTLDTEIPVVTADTELDIHEIASDMDYQDQYSDDIYEPLDAAACQSATRNHSERVSGRNYEILKPVDETAIEPVNSYAGQTVADTEHQTIDTETVMGNTDKPSESEVIIKTEEKASTEHRDYVFPPLSLLNRGSSTKGNGQARENRETAMRLQQTLQNFGVKVTITDISCGPSVTRYELQPEQGVKVSKIVSLADDIKLNLAAADIRIEAPIPGKAAIGIEVPNKEAGSVTFRELIESDSFKNHPSDIAFAAGKDIAGKIIVADIGKMPHLLIAGATGSGKSVCINTIIMSILYKANPDDVKLIMVDPKVVELSVYNGIPHLLTPVVTDPKKASGALNWAVAEMTDRYKRFAQLGVRDLKGYNTKIDKIDATEVGEKPDKMPHIVIIIDELADLMMVAPGEVEDAICRLAQLARAAGIHLVIATQRPSVNVITGLIKANVPSRIAFSVSSGVDSRTIIDMNGAEKLLGKGDMLFFPSGYPKPVRVQGAYVSDEEVSNVVEFLKSNMQKEVEYNEEIANMPSSGGETVTITHAENDLDPYFADAGRFVIEKEKGSIGMLQRYYKIGFNRAGRIMDQLTAAGVVGPEFGTKARKIVMTLDEFETYLKEKNIE